MLWGYHGIHQEGGIGQGRAWPLVLDTSWGLGWSHHSSDHDIQETVQKLECKFRHIIPAAVPVFHYEEERSHVSSNLIPSAPHRSIPEVEVSRRKDSIIHGP